MAGVSDKSRFGKCFLEVLAFAFQQFGLAFAPQKRTIGSYLRCRDWKTKQRPDLANQFVYYSVYMCERYRYMYV